MHIEMTKINGWCVIDANNDVALLQAGFLRDAVLNDLRTNDKTGQTLFHIHTQTQALVI